MKRPLLFVRKLFGLAIVIAGIATVLRDYVS